LYIWELNSVGFSIVKKLPFLPYLRSAYLLTGWKRVAKCSIWGGEGRYEKVVIIGLRVFREFIEGCANKGGD